MIPTQKQLAKEEKQQFYKRMYARTYHTLQLQLQCLVDRCPFMHHNSQVHMEQVPSAPRHDRRVGMRRCIALGKYNLIFRNNGAASPNTVNTVV